MMDAPDSDQRKKYIRTYAGDMEILKAGGVPDLKPLEKPPVSSEPPPPLPVPAPVPTPPPPPPLPTPVVRKEPPPPPIPAPAEPLKTYKDDFSGLVKKTGVSTATIIAAEQDAAQEAPDIAVHESPNRSRLYGIAGAALLLVGAVGAYFALTYDTTVSEPVATTPTTVPIFVDDRQEISGSGAPLLHALAASVNRTLAPRAVRLLYDASSTPADSIFTSLRPPAPDILLRNVRGNGSMAGVINLRSVQSPFFILSVTSFSNTLSGMLTWESSIRYDLAELFPAYPEVAPLVAATGTKKTTEVRAFTDEIIANHDVRIYRDAAGRSIIVYGYWNPNTLVIARDPEVFAELLGRLATARTP